MAESTNSINFSDLVLKGESVQAPKKASKKAAVPTFECVACSGADFVVKRSTPSASRLLVMLVSQSQFYIKVEKSGEILALTEKTLESFFQGLGERRIHIGCSWLESFTNDKKSRAAFIQTINADGFKFAATCGLLSFEDIVRRGSRYGVRGIVDMESFAKMSAPLMKHIGETASKLPRQKKRLLTSNVEAFTKVCDKYGLDLTREFVNRYVECSAFEAACEERDVSLRLISDLLSIVPSRTGIVAYRYRVDQRIYPNAETVHFQFSKLCDYLFDESAREGFMSLSEWLQNWKDTLLLQLYVGGKITDKYPSNLLTVHQVLSTEAARMQVEVDQARWAKAEAKMASFDYAPEGATYLVTHPATPNDMRVEAAAQSNCLSSYIDSVIAGRCMIFFMHKAVDPEASHLTIEVSSNLVLKQVKARFNREADDDSMRFVEEWCAEKGISMGAYASRVRKLAAA